VNGLPESIPFKQRFYRLCSLLLFTLLLPAQLLRLLLRTPSTLFLLFFALPRFALTLFFHLAQTFFPLLSLSLLRHLLFAMLRDRASEHNTKNDDTDKSKDDKSGRQTIVTQQITEHKNNTKGKNCHVPTLKAFGFFPSG